MWNCIDLLGSLYSRTASAYLPVRKPRGQPEVSVMDE